MAHLIIELPENLAKRIFLMGERLHKKSDVSMSTELTISAMLDLAERTLDARESKG